MHVAVASRCHVTTQQCTRLLGVSRTETARTGTDLRSIAEIDGRTAGGVNGQERICRTGVADAVAYFGDIAVVDCRTTDGVGRCLVVGGTGVACTGAVLCATITDVAAEWPAHRSARIHYVRRAGCTRTGALFRHIAAPGHGRAAHKGTWPDGVPWAGGSRSCAEFFNVTRTGGGST